jgi:pimeloyl-ACP methyl ester carboxylesterase
MLAHQRIGSGPPLVLMHGIGLDHRCWRPLLTQLTRERDVVALDLPGFGDSPGLGAPEVTALADSVEDTLRDLGVEHPHVAGNSLGGAVALELARRGRVASACGLSPAGFALGREQGYAERSLLLTMRMARALAPVAGAATRGPVRRTLLMSQIVARPWRIPPDDAADMIRATAWGQGFETTLPAIGRWKPEDGPVPTTIAWGERDRLLIASRQAPRAARRLPGARHLWLRGCGHVPMWDDPDQVARVLLDASANGI